MRGSKLRVLGFLAVGLMVWSPSTPTSAADLDAGTLREIRKQIRELKDERANDEKKIDELEKKLESLAGENAQLKAANAQVKVESAANAKAIDTMKEQVAAQPSRSDFSESISRYLGTHTFTVTGAAAFNFIYDQQEGSIADIHNASQNSFFFDWEPMILYRPTDWILFEGVLGAGFGSTGTGVDLSTAVFHLFVNDNVTVVGGLFDQPFGDWYEDQSPMWVNRFITAPLPFAVNPVVPPGEIGLQLRGPLQFGEDGQYLDYTIWIGNGPSFSDGTNPVPGSVMGAPTAVANKQTNGIAYGGRFRVYPLPVDSDWGRLELGVSTYDGKWLDGNYLTSWGLDYNYFIGNLQTRGEFLRSYRQMPAPYAQDNREGWYIQFGYFLNGLGRGILPDVIQNYVDKSEALVRYSGVNQHFVNSDDINSATGMGQGGIQAGLIPDFGLSNSPSMWAPHSREVALGFDYWFAPSIVWQNELDLELPHAGGNFIDGSGNITGVTNTPNDKAFLTQFTVGF